MVVPPRLCIDTPDLYVGEEGLSRSETLTVIPLTEVLEELSDGYRFHGMSQSGHEVCNPSLDYTRNRGLAQFRRGRVLNYPLISSPHRWGAVQAASCRSERPHDSFISRFSAIVGKPHPTLLTLVTVCSVVKL